MMTEEERQAILADTTVGCCCMATIPDCVCIVTIATAADVLTARQQAADFLAAIGEPGNADNNLPYPCLDSNGDVTHYLCVMHGAQQWADVMEQYCEDNADELTTVSYFGVESDDVLAQYNLTSPALAQRNQEEAARVAKVRADWKAREVQMGLEAEQRKQSRTNRGSK